MTDPMHPMPAKPMPTISWWNRLRESAGDLLWVASIALGLWVICGIAGYLIYR